MWNIKVSLKHEGEVETCYTCEPSSLERDLDNQNFDNWHSFRTRASSTIARLLKDLNIITVLRCFLQYIFATEVAITITVGVGVMYASCQEIHHSGEKATALCVQIFGPLRPNLRSNYDPLTFPSVLQIAHVATVDMIFSICKDTIHNLH